MSGRDEQYDRQPPLPPAESQNPRNTRAICRNFLWGTCTMHPFCKFRHEFDFKSMRRNLKFCHDFQNRNGCRRDSCTYLHATRNEENLFYATGQLPRVLAERHAAMYTRETYVPRPAAALAAPPPPLPPSFPLLSTLHIQHPPPPLPPPPVALTGRALYTAPPVPPPSQHSPMTFPISHPPPVMFRAREPPSLLPTQSGTRKHKLSTFAEAGPSKIRKAEDSNNADAQCVHCVQQQTRLKMYSYQAEILDSLGDSLNKVEERTLEEYEIMRNCLRVQVTADLFRVIERQIQGENQHLDVSHQSSCNLVHSETSGISNSNGNSDESFSGSSTSRMVSSTPVLLAANSAETSSTSWLDMIPLPPDQPTVPPPPLPPTIPHYNQMLPSNIMNGASTPVTVPMQPRPSTSAALPDEPQTANTNMYIMGKYPPPHGFPPY